MTFQKNINSFSKNILQKEDNHLMGVSKISETYLKIPSHLETHEKELLTYFLPLADQIKTDLNLVEAVFEQVLELKKGGVKITCSNTFLKSINQYSIDNWQLGVNMIVAGKNRSKEGCFIIELKLLKDDNLEDYVVSGSKRKLLEEILIPNFLSEKADFNIKIEVPESAKKFILDEKIKGGRINISTII